MARCLLALVLFGLAAFQLPGEELNLPVDNLTRKIQAGETHSYTFRADAGDYLSGRIELNRTPGVQNQDVTFNLYVHLPPVVTLAVYGPDNAKIRTNAISSPDSYALGFFIAPILGTYRIDITATGALPDGSYTLSMIKVAPSVRMAGQHAEPRAVYRSERIATLEGDIQQGKTASVDEFWTEAAKRGGPIVEPIRRDDQNVLATFLWRETYETHNVLLAWPAAGNRADDYYMSRVPGSNVWYKTVRVRRGSRFTYSLSPNDRAGDRPYTAQTDPLNPRYWPEDLSPVELGVTSVFELPGAPDDKWWRQTPAKRGDIKKTAFNSNLLKGAVDVWVYTPPGYTAANGPYPLVLLLDNMAGPAYITSIAAQTSIDNLIAEGRIRPPVVAITGWDGNSPRKVPYSSDNKTSASVIATEMLPWLRSNYSLSGEATDVIIGGESAGALLAAYIALQHPTIFGNVLSQSGAFRQSMVPGSSEPNSLAQMYVEAPHFPIRFYIDAGLYEPFPGRPLDELALDESNTAGNRHFRDVLKAKGYDVTYRETGGDHTPVHWRATLPEALMKLLGPK